PSLLAATAPVLALLAVVVASGCRSASHDPPLPVRPFSTSRTAAPPSEPEPHVRPLLSIRESGPVRALALSRDGRVLAALGASAPERISVRRAPDGTLLRTLTRPGGPTLSLELSPDGGILAVGSGVITPQTPPALS